MLENQWVYTFMSYGWTSFTDRYKHLCHLKHRVIQMKSARACLRCFWWGWSEWVEKGGAFVTTAHHAQFYHYTLQNWLQRLFNISAEAMIIFFVIVTIPKRYDSKQNQYHYVTGNVKGWQWWGIKRAVLQISQKWKDPMGRKSHWSVIKQVLLNSLCFFQLKATWHMSHHKMIYSMDFGWSLFSCRTWILRPCIGRRCYINPHKLKVCVEADDILLPHVLEPTHIFYKA